MKRYTRKQLFEQVREHVKNAAPFTLWFAPHRDRLTKKQQQELEDYLRYHFHIWANTWVLPWVEEIEKRSHRTKKVKAVR